MLAIDNLTIISLIAQLLCTFKKNQHVKKIEQENILKWLSEQKEVKLQVPSLELQNKYAYQLQKSLDELEISYIKRSLEMPSYSNSNRKQKTL